MSDGEPGIIKAFFRSTFGFRKTTLSLLVLLSYFGSIVLTGYYENRALSVPQPEPSLLSSSWLDLQIITRTPHPYDSHANDLVHDYILQRVKKLAKLQDYIEISDGFGEQYIFKQKDVFDPDSTANRILYFEGGNVLVKIAGKKPSLEGVLISAHYDSVPTAYGVTDDGMGIASMLGILEHYATTGEQPLRNIIFNFNNDEEFGLLGATVFLEHEWSKLVEYFINLEGTGAGGRAILFRATDNGITSYYNNVRSPFGNSIFQQGFQSGLIRSETDYKVYAQNGMRGVDIAFYKPRNLYHTKFDNIQGSSKGSLWHMLSNSLDLLTSLSNSEGISTDTSPSAFFDVLGLVFFSVSVDTLYVLNILVLTLSPVINIVLLMIVGKRGTWHVSFGKGWLRLPVSIVASSLGALTLSNFISSYNPLVLGSDWLSVLISITSFFILINYLIINFVSWLRPVHDQKLIFLLELSFFLWVLLIVSTVRVHLYGMSGEYGITLIYSLVSLATIFGLLTLVFKPKQKFKRVSRISYGATSVENNTPSILSPGTSKSAQNNHSADEDENLDERDSLLQSTSHDAETRAEEPDQVEEPIDEGYGESEESFNYKIKSAALKSFSYDWSIQFLLFVPLSIFISYSLGELVMQGLNYTGQESNSLVISTFKLLSYFLISLGLPLLPFIHKLNFFLFNVVLFGFLIGAAISLYQDPFNSHSPLKISFVQTIDLSSGSSEPLARVSGKGDYVEQILKDIPSISGSSNAPICNTNLQGRTECSYDSLRPWLIDGTVDDNDLESYLKIEVTHNDNNKTGDTPSSPFAPLSADIKIWAPDNRNCVINFNSTKYDSSKKSTDKSLSSPVKTLKIYHDGDEYVMPNATILRRSQNIVSTDALGVRIPSGPSYDPVEGVHYFKILGGVDDFQLHKVNFTSPFYHIGLEWFPEFEFVSDIEQDESLSNNLGVTVTCYWGEYEAESIISDASGVPTSQRKIPAFDELLHFAPDYVAVSNYGKGLVVVKNYVEL